MKRNKTIYMNTNTRIFFWSLIVALGGFLFGFDTAVISGVEKSLQELFVMSPFMHGFAISSALIGTVIGALVVGKPTDIIGRKPMLYLIALCYVISAIGTALAINLSMFIFLRFLGGLAIGASSVVAPMYISEISPANVRGKMTALFQLNVIVGIMMAFISNYLLRDVGESAWRWMLGVETFPAVAWLLLLLLVPESPRYLIKINDEIKARTIFEKTGIKDIDHEITEIRKNLSQKQGKLFSRVYFNPIFIVFLVAMFNQFSGINAILYFAPRIFELSGMSQKMAFFQPVIIGVTNAFFTLLGMLIVDKVGRRSLLIVGSTGMSIFLGLVSLSFFSVGIPNHYLLWFLVGYIMFFAFSTGTVIWVLISEVFPNSVRGKGQSFGSFTHWFFAALITFLFPVISSGFQYGTAFVFLFFCIMTVAHAIVAWLYFPETKGRTIESISNDLSGG